MKIKFDIDGREQSVSLERIHEIPEGHQITVAMAQHPTIFALLLQGLVDAKRTHANSRDYYEDEKARAHERCKSALEGKPTVDQIKNAIRLDEVVTKARREERETASRVEKIMACVESLRHRKDMLMMLGGYMRSQMDALKLPGAGTVPKNPPKSRKGYKPKGDKE